MQERTNNIIKTHWERMVHGSYFYRGMSLNNLNLESSIVLDPSKNPFESIIPLLMEYSALLSTLIEEGLECNVNDFYVEPLQKVLGWTIRDIKNPGIDFTSNYADAASYAFNHAGSQIKHNFNLIVNSIHEHKNQACFGKIEKEKFWDMTNKIKIMLEADKPATHQPIVVKVKRSCAAFENEDVSDLNVGSCEFFCKRAIEWAEENNMLAVEKIAFFLHQRSQNPNFNIRLIKPLHKTDIEEVIKLWKKSHWIHANLGL